MNRLPAMMLALSAMTLLMGNTSCEEPLNDDPFFDVWCGDALCSWSVEEGEIKRVATWRSGDDGVALVGPEVSLSQVSEKRFDCFEFDLLTDIDPATTVLLEMDFQDDGSVEYSQPIDGKGWKRLEYRITPPDWYSSVRIRVRKLTEGRAVLGRIHVTRGGGCVTEPLELNDRPEGASCESGDQCLSGTCMPVQIGLCSETDDLVGCDAMDASACEAIPGSECMLLGSESVCQ